jgi:aminoglycoside phosphotransferase (APT) family kinase protein
MVSQADHEGRIAAALEANLRRATGQALRLGAGLERLTGGFDTETYGFRLEGAHALSGDLVLRLFRGARESGRVRSEAAIQNQVARGYPVPRVPIDTVGWTIMGKPYLIMRRLPGRSLLDSLADSSVTAELAGAAGVLLGTAQAQLHNLPADEAMRALTRFDHSTWTPHRLLADIQQLAEVTGEPLLVELAHWLDERWPAAPATPSLCHGDFHPGNVLVEDMRLTGVIDWTNFASGHPEFDVAITRLILSIGLVAEDDRPIVTELLRGHEQAYQVVRSVDSALVRYYTVLRAARAMARIVAAQHGAELRGAAPDGYAWSQPRPYAAIRKVIRDETGLGAPEPAFR